MDLLQQLIRVAKGGDVAGVAVCLAAGADVNGQDFEGTTALLGPVQHERQECVAALLAAGADPNKWQDAEQLQAPLHTAVFNGSLACVELLLGAGADPLVPFENVTLVELAAFERPALAPVLLQAVPAAALEADRDMLKLRMVCVALIINSLDCARRLLSQGALPPADDVLDMLSGTGAWAQPLYAILAIRQPMTVWQWKQVPSPCPGLAAALPAVLQRATAEAALLVRRLPAGQKERLRTAALCLGRAQGQANTPLPTPILWHLLLQSVIDCADVPPAPAAVD